MTLDRKVCDRARRSRDPRFDGRFFIGVTTTHIYCRPICPARAPKDEHVRYFPSAAAAEAAGFRPCLRCRPEAAPGTPAWRGTSSVVSRALGLIGEGALDDSSVERLAERLGVTARHLRRLFLEHLGATPLDVALTRRAHFAKKLLDETSLAVQDVAIAAGFGSVRRFNDHVRRAYGRTPTELRRATRPRTVGDAAGSYRFRLAYRPPYDWNAVLAFLAARATPGVEAVVQGQYRRTVQIGAQSGIIRVSPVAACAALELEVRFGNPRGLLPIVERVRRMFDLVADPAIIHQHLAPDPLLGPLLDRHPGIRVPGAWDSLELAVRAILGQQVSVRAATTVAGRVAALFGAPVAGDSGLDRLFPSPAHLADAPLERAGVMPGRAATIRSLARHVASGAISFRVDADEGEIVAALSNVSGIGPWTAGYVAMRGLSAPDAFPSGDLVLRRMAGDCTARALERRSDAWRPWRAYAAMLLWQAAHPGPVSARSGTRLARRLSDAPPHSHLHGSAARPGASRFAHGSG